MTTRPTVSILPPLSNTTKMEEVTGGWAQMKPGLLVLDEDCVTALLHQLVPSGFDSGVLLR